MTLLRFPYDQTEQPPAPFVEVQVAPHGTTDFVMMRAKVDCGAAITVLPRGIVLRWRLRPFRWIYLRAFNGRITRQRTYRVDITLGNRRFDNVEVTAASRTDILLGRDILNQIRVVFGRSKASREDTQCLR